MGGAASLRLFRVPNFRALWIGQFISIFGDRFTYLALLALVIERARDPMNRAAELSLIPVVSFLPAILFAPWIGALVDRWNTRATLLISDAARGVIVLAIIPAVAWGGLPAAFSLLFLLYFVNTFFLPARSAILPELVAQDHLVEANSLATLAGVLATITGSLLGGVVIERSGWRLGFILDAGTYFLSVGALAWIRPKPHLRTPRDRGTREAYRALAADVRDGARLALASPRVLGSIGALMALWAAGGALHVSAPTVMEGRGTGIISSVGAIIACAAAGMAAGTLLLAARGRAGSTRARIEGALVGTGIALAALAAFPLQIATAGAAFAAGIFVAILLVTTEVVIQESIAEGARGRVFALRDFLGRLAVLVSAAAFGFLLKRGGLTPVAAIGVAGVALVLVGFSGAVARIVQASRSGRVGRGI